MNHGPWPFGAPTYSCVGRGCEPLFLVERCPQHTQNPWGGFSEWKTSSSSPPKFLFLVVLLLLRHSDMWYGSTVPCYQCYFHGLCASRSATCHSFNQRSVIIVIRCFSPEALSCLLSSAQRETNIAVQHFVMLMTTK